MYIIFIQYRIPIIQNWVKKSYIKTFITQYCHEKSTNHSRMLWHHMNTLLSSVSWPVISPFHIFSVNKRVLKMQRFYLCPEPPDEDVDLPALCLYLSPDDALGIQPSASYQPTVEIEPSASALTVEIQPSASALTVGVYELVSLVDVPLQSNHLTFEPVHVLPQNALDFISWVDLQMPQSEILPQTVCLSYCTCPQPVMVYHLPAQPNM